MNIHLLYPHGAHTKRGGLQGVPQPNRYIIMKRKILSLTDVRDIHKISIREASRVESIMGG